MSNIICELRIHPHLWSSDVIGYWFIINKRTYHHGVIIQEKYEIMLRSWLE